MEMDFGMKMHVRVMPESVVKKSFLYFTIVKHTRNSMKTVPLKTSQHVHEIPIGWCK